MRALGRIGWCCLNPSCRDEGLIDVSKFADDVEVPAFAMNALLRQVWLAWPAHRCETKLERTAAPQLLARADEVIE
jgi:hypothetical protein